MAAKIRVYELARELGLTNAECLELCESLGIGVKSHSSSMEEAHADRARRKAEREGLIRDEQPEDEKEKKKREAAEKKAAAKAAKEAEKAAKEAERVAGLEAEAAEAAKAAAEAEADLAALLAAQAKAAAPAETPAAPAAPAPVAEAPVAAAPPAAPVAETPAPVEAPAAEAPAPVAPPIETPVAEVAPEPPAPAPAPKRVISSSGSKPPQRPAASAPEPPKAPSAPAAPVNDIGAKPSAPAAPTAPVAAKAEAGDAATPPTSASGKPIPPPPGPPQSRTGKPIPPPPGRGGRGPAPAAPGRSRPGGNTGGGGGGGARPGGPGGGGPGGGTGRPGGRPGGGPGRRPPRRRGRRRRNIEELQPMDTPSYTPDDAAIPEGEIVIERSSTPLDLGPKFNRTAADVVRFLMQQGEMVTATQSLTDDMIELFAAELGAEIRMVDPGEEQEVELMKLLGADEEVDTSDSPSRPPVITIMGHVDHGKTLLLDRIRQANVVDGEAGGITQHIGAYQIERDGKKLTFIDTPGHEAFTAMRRRGAQATDIVVLVVAADDGVMPQTIEALNHAKAAEVPIVVAVNKIDREGSNPDRVYQELAEHELITETWGGDVVTSQVSALKSIGIDELIDNLILVSEVEDLRADPEGQCTGAVLESHLDIGRGPVSTVLVQSGTLRVGDALVAGPAWGRVRALVNDQGEQVKEAGPSTPVEVLGLSEPADAGDQFVIAPSEKVASKVADAREYYHRQTNLGRDAHAMSGGAKLEDVFSQIQAGEAATLNLLLKADVNGSLEACTESLRKLERDEVKLAFVHRAVGGITENDIQLAAASDATILGFNVRPDRKARQLAEEEGVEIRTYEIIYKMLEEIESAMIGMLAPEYEEIITGDAEVRELFKVPKIGTIAGCMVKNGVITRGSKVRFLRDGAIIWTGDISSLRRFKDDVKEVASGYECGIGLSDFQDLRDGDIIETYEEREIART